MTPQVSTSFTVKRRASPKLPVRARRYVVVFQCPHCKRNGIVDDFEGEYDVTCCGESFTVSLTEGRLPDWAQ